MDKKEIYLNQYTKCLSEASEYHKISDIPTQLKKRMAYYGVKIFNSEYEDPKLIIRKVAEERFQSLQIVNSIIGLLTPNEFIEVFPIEKFYKGKKYEMKDYFYVKEYISNLPDEPIGDRCEEFIMEYMNPDIQEYAVNSMMALSNLCKLEGQPTPMDIFCEIYDIEKLTYYEDEGILVNSKGEVRKVKKKRPRYLKVCN